MPSPHYINLIASAQNSPTQVWQTQTLPNSAEKGDSDLYGTFNLGLHVKDSPTQVHHNRAKLLQSIQNKNPKIQRIHWLNQVHGDKVVDVDGMPLEQSAISADAHITSDSRVALAIMTADCVPIMIASGSDDKKEKQDKGNQEEGIREKGEVVAGVHAGWQGLAKGIIANTINAMREKTNASSTDNWQAWVGACIARQHYEVDERVRTQVLNQLEQQLAQQNQSFSENDKNRFFTPQPQKTGHYLADLPAISQFQLLLCGFKLENIHLSGFDSYGDGRFYSYRQQTENSLPFTGRMATLIFRA